MSTEKISTVEIIYLPGRRLPRESVMIFDVPTMFLNFLGYTSEDDLILKLDEVRDIYHSLSEIPRIFSQADSQTIEKMRNSYLVSKEKENRKAVENYRAFDKALTIGRWNSLRTLEHVTVSCIKDCRTIARVVIEIL